MKRAMKSIILLALALVSAFPESNLLEDSSSDAIVPEDTSSLDGKFETEHSIDLNEPEPQPEDDHLGDADDKPMIHNDKPLPHLAEEAPKANKRVDVSISLAGGGARAMGMAAGAFKAFNAHNILRKIDSISSSSGGSWFSSTYHFSKRFQNAINNPNTTAGEDYHEFLNFRNTVGSMGNQLLLLKLGWQGFIQKMMDAYDPGTSMQAMSPGNRKDDTSSELIFVSSLPASAHILDKNSDADAGKSVLLDHGNQIRKFGPHSRPPAGVRITFTVPPKESEEPSAWWLPGGRSFDNMKVEGQGPLKVDMSPIVGLVTAASSAFPRTNEKANGVMRKAKIARSKGVAFTAKLGVKKLTKLVPDFNDIAPCTYTPDKSGKGCGTVPGQYRFYDGCYVSKAFAAGIARRQAKVGPNAVLKLIMVDNVPADGGKNSRFWQFDTMFSLGMLDTTIGSQVLDVNGKLKPPPFVTVANGKVMYRRVSATTTSKATASWGVVAGTAVELLLVAPAYTLEHTDSNHNGIGIGDPCPNRRLGEVPAGNHKPNKLEKKMGCFGREASDRDAELLKQFANDIQSGMMDPSFAKILKDFVSEAKA